MKVRWVNREVSPLNWRVVTTGRCRTTRRQLQLLGSRWNVSAAVSNATQRNISLMTEVQTCGEGKDTGAGIWQKTVSQWWTASASLLSGWDVLPIWEEAQSERPITPGLLLLGYIRCCTQLLSRCLAIRFDMLSLILFIFLTTTFTFQATKNANTIDSTDFHA